MVRHHANAPFQPWWPLQLSLFFHALTIVAVWATGLSACEIGYTESLFVWTGGSTALLASVLLAKPPAAGRTAVPIALLAGLAGVCWCQSMRGHYGLTELNYPPSPWQRFYPLLPAWNATGIAMYRDLAVAVLWTGAFLLMAKLLATLARRWRPGRALPRWGRLAIGASVLYAAFLLQSSLGNSEWLELSAARFFSARSSAQLPGLYLCSAFLAAAMFVPARPGWGMLSFFSAIAALLVIEFSFPYFSVHRNLRLPFPALGCLLAGFPLLFRKLEMPGASHPGVPFWTGPALAAPFLLVLAAGWWFVRSVDTGVAMGSGSLSKGIWFAESRLRDVSIEGGFQWWGNYLTFRIGPAASDRDLMTVLGKNPAVWSAPVTLRDMRADFDLSGLGAVLPGFTNSAAAPWSHSCLTLKDGSISPQQLADLLNLGDLCLMETGLVAPHSADSGGTGQPSFRLPEKPASSLILRGNAGWIEQTLTLIRPEPRLASLFLHIFENGPENPAGPEFAEFVFGNAWGAHLGVHSFLPNSELDLQIPPRMRELPWQSIDLVLREADIRFLCRILENRDWPVTASFSVREVGQKSREAAVYFSTLLAGEGRIRGSAPWALLHVSGKTPDLETVELAGCLWRGESGSRYTGLLAVDENWIRLLDAPEAAEIEVLLLTPIWVTERYNQESSDVVDAAKLAQFTSLKTLCLGTVGLGDVGVLENFPELETLQSGIREPESRSLLAASLPGLPNLHTLVFDDIPDQDLVAALLAHPGLKELVIQLTLPDGESSESVVAQLRSRMPGIAVKLVEPHAWEPVELTGQRRAISSRLLKEYAEPLPAGNGR